MSSQENLFRSLKRNPSKRYEQIIFKDLEIGMDYIPSIKLSHEFKELKDKVGHVPMKKESEELRKIMSRTGLSKDEVVERSIYKERLVKKTLIVTPKILSYEKLFLKIAKNVMKEMNLPIWNEVVIENIKNILKNNIEKHLEENPYYEYCDCCGYNKQTYSFSDYIFNSTSIDIIDEVLIWRNIISETRNVFLKKYMIISKKKRGKI